LRAPALRAAFRGCRLRATNIHFGRIAGATAGSGCARATLSGRV